MAFFDRSRVLEEAKSLVLAAQTEGLTLRVAGSVGIILSAPSRVGLFEAFDRSVKDLDLVGLIGQAKGVERLLSNNGYLMIGGSGITVGVFHKRRIYHDPSGNRLDIDIIFDEFDFCHRIDLRKRLILKPLALSPTDLFLTKIQIVEMTRNDFVDLVVLLLEYPESTAEGGFDDAYVSNLLSRNWGFYHTTVTNLDKLGAFAQSEPALKGQQDTLLATISRLQSALRADPKSLKWKVRSLVGTKLPWYTEVGEGLRT